ncbi:MAG: hypothetical protein Q9208_007179 [Pyrenodesmia sp. 3 TL-2023]
MAAIPKDFPHVEPSHIGKKRPATNFTNEAREIGDQWDTSSDAEFREQLERQLEGEDLQVLEDEADTNDAGNTGDAGNALGDHQEEGVEGGHTKSELNDAFRNDVAPGVTLQSTPKRAARLLRIKELKEISVLQARALETDKDSIQERYSAITPTGLRGLGPLLMEAWNTVIERALGEGWKKFLEKDLR